MKAMVYTEYGPPEVLQLKQFEKPAPDEDEVLVEVQAASVNPLDWHYMRGSPFLVRFMAGLLKPKQNILGADIAGRVEATGSEVEEFQVGDEVFGGIGVGGFAEYVAVAEELLVHKPATISFEEAAAVPVAGLTALQRLRDDGRLQPGQTVLVNGASGGVGTYAVQIANVLGAEVTAVCSTRNVEMARSLGADDIIDYTQEDFTQRGRRYDLILDNVGNHSLSACERVLSADGMYLYNSDSMVRIIQVMIKGIRGGENGRTWRTADLTKYNQSDLDILKKYLENGKIESVIDRRYPLSQVPEAIGYVEEGHARGKVIIMVVTGETDTKQASPEL